MVNYSLDCTGLILVLKVYIGDFAKMSLVFSLYTDDEYVLHGVQIYQIRCVMHMIFAAHKTNCNS